MSLYNALFGENPAANIFLELLGLTKNDFYRYRDCYLAHDEKGEHSEMIAVHTRGGGGNRQDNDTDVEDHPYYLFDSDDDFDCTYCTYYFKIPEAAKHIISLLGNLYQVERDPETHWNDLFEKLNRGDKSDPAVQNALKVGEQVFNALGRARQKKESTHNG